MKARRLVFVPCMLAAMYGHAGHGLMNSFGDVEWLPDPGATPDQIAYPLDRMRERFELELAGSAEAEMTLCLKFAREKLAEASAMVKAGDTDAATVAIESYGAYIERAAEIVESRLKERVATRRHQFVTALLEHVYIMSVDYLDMPLGIRTVVSTVFTTAMAQYTATSSKLPKREKERLFFKEDEVQWSLEMIRQADLQHITN